MERVTLSSINQYVSATVNPADTPEDLFELYSVPSYENQYPEIVKGKEIGSAKAVVQEGDVLICKINPKINRVWVVKHNTEYPLLASSEWIVVRNSAINSNYLKWYFMSPFFRKLLTSQVAGIGGSLTRAQPKQVAKYPVPIVELEKQGKIVNLLEKVNFVISACQQQLAKLDELVKARFVEMFGDSEYNTKHWPVVKLSDICEVGSSKRIYKNEQSSSGVPFLRISDLNERIDGKVKNPEIFISIEKYDELKLQGMVPIAGDVLVTSRGTLGRCYIVTEEDVFYFQDGMISWLSKIDARAASLYLSYLFSMRGIQKQIEMLQAGSTVAYLSITMLKKLDIMLPPPELQRRFLSFAEQIDKLKLSIKKSLEQMKTLKKALMQQYFG